MSKPNMTPCLWFDGNAEEAAAFYVSVFQSAFGKDSARQIAVARYGKAASQASGQTEGSVMTVAFELRGQPYLALNGGPAFHFTPALSLMVHCDKQEEIDKLHKALATGDPTEQCGWVKDKFGLSWQLVPRRLEWLMTSGDPERADRAMAALVQMRKLDIRKLEKAYLGK